MSSILIHLQGGPLSTLEGGSVMDILINRFEPDKSLDTCCIIDTEQIWLELANSLQLFGN